MRILPIHRAAAGVMVGVLTLAGLARAADAPTTAPATRPIGEKELYIPVNVYHVPEGNDYNDPNSEFSFARSVQSPNLALFWSKEYGQDPMANPDPSKRFDVQRAIQELERFYAAYVDQLKFVDRGHSLTDRYKMLVYVIGGTDGTAFGGGAEDKIGILWTPASRINKAPYGALAHELGHSFQFMTGADGAQRMAGGSIAEMTSQYMLWQVYPEWMTFENYHLVAFMKQTHLAFLHPENQYHSPYVLEYWSSKHGVDFIGRIWREAKRGEDPVMVYKRLAGLEQPAFNDEMFDACRRFITWDLPRVESVARQYANQHTTSLHDVGQGWFEIAKEKCPQNYGYNGIKLTVPAGGTTVTLSFKGEAGAPGFSRTQLDKAGWRYGLLAMKSDGSRVYSDVGSTPEGEVTFTVPPGTEHLWAVVMGAPSEHWIRQDGRRGRPGSRPTTAPAEEQWPYRIKLTGAELDPSTIAPATTQPAQ